MDKAKIITICGSLKYTEKLMEVTENLTLEGFNVISVIYETKERDFYTEKEIKMFTELHYQKIDLCDSIYVVNVNGHVGEGTKRDIEYAKSLGKEINYLEN